MNESMTDKAREKILKLFGWATLYGRCMWGLGHDMAGFLAIYAPLTLGVGIGETANIAKRATANPEVMEAEARIRNGSPPPPE